nr:hypothetical protein [Corynebacterium striatum]
MSKTFLSRKTSRFKVALKILLGVIRTRSYRSMDWRTPNDEQ